MKRGYNVLLWDGPGMGQTIRLQGLPFRYDWENVLSPVIDYVSSLPQVDETHLALITVSLGGYLGPRAATFDHRLRGIVANPGVLNWFQVYSDFLAQIDPNLLSLLESDPDAFDEVVTGIMSQNDFMMWGMVDSMWHFGADTPSELMKEVQRYNINEGMFANWRTPALIIDAEAEERGQAKEMYDAIPDEVNKKYLYFTDEEAASLHVQPGATGLWSARTFDWLDEIFLLDTGDVIGVGASGSSSSGSTIIVSPPYSVLYLLLIMCAWCK